MINLYVVISHRLIFIKKILLDDLIISLYVSFAEITKKNKKIIKPQVFGMFENQTWGLSY